jgi:hypothetical protein
MNRNVWAFGFGLWLLPFIAVTSFAQISFERTYGDSGSEMGNSVQQSSDGGYIITGYTDSFGAGGGDVYLIKTDSLGDTLWTKTYGDSLGDFAWSVQETSDDGYILAGYTASFGAGGGDVYLIKTNSSGDTLWTKTYGGGNDDWAYSVQETSDNGYILGGYTSSFGAGGVDVYLIKTDSLGDTLWTKTYGGSLMDYAWSVRETSDNGYIISGFTVSFGVGGDVYLIKIDSSGDTLWTKTYGGSDWDQGYSVQQTFDSGYIIVGFTWSYGAGARDAYLIKTDSLGDTLWTKTYGGLLEDLAMSVQETSDLGYIIAGSSNSFGVADNEVYLIKTNSFGDSSWTRTYGGPFNDDDHGNSVQQTSDGGYIIAGSTNSFGAGLDDVYLIKTDGNGMVVGIEESNDEYRTRNIELRLMQNYPNPFNKLTAVSYKLKVPSHTTLQIYDITGRLVEILVDEHQKPGVYQLPITSNQFPSSGIYFYRLQSGDFTSTKKLILLK